MQVGYTPDYLFLLQTILRSDPQVFAFFINIDAWGNVIFCLPVLGSVMSGSSAFGMETRHNFLNISNICLKTCSNFCGFLVCSHTLHYSEVGF